MSGAGRFASEESPKEDKAAWHSEAFFQNPCAVQSSKRFVNPHLVHTLVRLHFQGAGADSLFQINNTKDVEKYTATGATVHAMQVL